MNTPKKILVIRNDKIGDFMLAWPAFALLKKQYPKVEITALVPQYTAPLAEQCEWIDKVLIDNKETSFIKDIFNLSKKIRMNNYDVSISLFSEFRTSISLWLAHVATRIGPATKIAQIFLNRKVRQKRSKSVKPEYEYNLDLIKYFIESNGDTRAALQRPPYLSFDRDEIVAIKKIFKSSFSVAENSTLVFIHPGTGGSAINLSLEKYADIARNISKNVNAFFIITAGPGEIEIAEKLSELLSGIHHCTYHSTHGIVEFSKLISICDLFISGSTGPLHIAGALNVPTAAFYPARRSATPLRWQTLNQKERRLAITPEKHIDENDMQTIDTVLSADKIYNFLLVQSNSQKLTDI